MNADKWKSVVVATATYRKLKRRAVKNHRTISGEFTHILELADRRKDPPPPTEDIIKGLA